MRVVDTRLNWEKKIRLLRDSLIVGVNESQLPKDVRKYILSYIDLLEAKNYIDSNFDDLLWFCKNGLSEDDRILDFGTGGGYIAYLIADLTKNIVAYDYMGGWTDQKYRSLTYFSAFSFIHKVINNIGPLVPFKFYQKLPLEEKEASFDGIILYAVIEHIDPEVKDEVFAELYRLLKPGGLLYIAKLPRLYSYQEFVSRKLKLGGHSDLYTESKTKELLNKYSFGVVKIERTGLYVNYNVEMTRRLFPVFKFIERVLKFTPVSFFSHDYRLIAKKI